MNKRTITTTLAAILITVPGPLLAQRPGRNPLRGQMRGRIEMEQRIRATFERRMFAQLGLTADERSNVQDVMVTFHQRRVDLMQREREARERVQDLQTRQADGEEIAESEARTALDAITQLRDEEAQLFRDEQTALLQVLRPDQVLSVFQLRADLAQRIRRLRQGGGQGGSMMPGGGPPPGAFRPGRDWPLG